MSILNRPVLQFILSSLTLLAPCSLLLAAEDSYFSLSLGGFVTDYDTETRLDSNNNRSIDVDLEDDLGLDSSDSVFRIDGYYKFNPRHRFDFSVFDLSRSATNPVQRGIQWGDKFYSVDTLVESDFDLKVYKAAYTYSFLVSDRGYLGITAGLYVADINITLTDQTLLQAERGDVTAPLPVLGIRGEYELSENWTLRASGEFFALEIDDKFSGSLSDLFIGLDYQLFENTAVGIGFNSVAIDVSLDLSSFAGALDWKYDGGLAYLKFDF